MPAAELMSTTSRRPAPPRGFIVYLAMLVAVAPMALDAYLPALPIMAEFFRVDIVAMNNTVSTFLLGNALGVLCAGPVSDQKGRKPVGITGLVLFTLSSAGIALSGTALQIQLLRFLQAIGSGMATVVCMPSIRDVYKAREAGSRFALVMMIMSLAPMLAPVLGAALLAINWQAIFFMLAGYGTVLLVWGASSIPETRTSPVTAFSLRIIFSQYLSVLTHRSNGRFIAMRYALSLSFIGGVLMTYLTNSSFTYIQYFGVSESVFPALFGATPVSSMLTSYLCSRLIKRVNPQLLFKLGNAAQFCCVALLTGVIYLGLDSLFLVATLIVLGISMLGFINPSGATLYLGFFKELSGSANSLVTTFTYILGAGFGALSGVFFDGSLLPMALTMLVASTLSNLVAFTIPAATPGED